MELLEDELTDQQGVYVNVYLVEQCYGGPEEGGWWYDVGDPIESIYVPPQDTATDTWDSAQHVLDTKRTYYDTLNQDRRPKHSVLSDGVYELRLEDCFATPFPEAKPFYE